MIQKTYESSRVEVVEVIVEQGFALSPQNNSVTVEDAYWD